MRALLLVSLTAGCATVASPEADVAAARALFQRNIDAIQSKDRGGYLACYLDDDALVRSGPGGPQLGFAALAAGTSTVPASWPESLEASDVQLHWLAPGLVYGSYKYRVVFAGAASEGISERVFAQRTEGWRIVVTTAFGAPASSDARLADLAFLAGNWAVTEGGRTTEEWWSPARGGSMMGSSRTIADGRTVAFEHLRVVEEGGAIVLIASPQGQATTRFELVERGGGQAVFANPTHDFPQRISYRRDGDKLIARIEGGGKSMMWTYQAQ